MLMKFIENQKRKFEKLNLFSNPNDYFFDTDTHTDELGIHY